ncbi:Autolysin [Streptococcus mitis]|uniref:Autolysin n=1 Tax=Streptococcus mitis TaxID=28037 RepID=A0A428I1U0_STRMT|nr:N-acetylmuramoyl-L-alanine amidase family protein [Streptococcus mitis]RSK03023.1 Autolysin [Streptococcus mitis]
MKKSKLLTLGLLAGAGLLLSINQAQAADTWVKSGADWNLSQDGSLAKNKWVQNAGSWYHFDASGNMQTGWLKDGNTWYSLADSGAMRTGWYKEGSTWYYLKDSGAMATGWATANGQWSYFENSGAMVADRAVPASDGESYVIGKDGYMLTRLPSEVEQDPFDDTVITDIVTLSDGYDYHLVHKKDGVVIEKNAWYIKPIVERFSYQKIGDIKRNTLDAITDNKKPGEEIDPKAVIKNFQNLPNKYYFGVDGRKVANLPEFTTHFPIQKVGSELYLKNSSPVISLDSSGLTINDNKLYLRGANDNNGKLVTGYFTMFMDGLLSKDHHILGYADESGEIVKMKVLPNDFRDHIEKGISGFYGETVRYDGSTGNVSVVK